MLPTYFETGFLVGLDLIKYSRPTGYEVPGILLSCGLSAGIIDAYRYSQYF